MRAGDQNQRPSLWRASRDHLKVDQKTFKVEECYPEWNLLPEVRTLQGADDP